MSDYKTTIYCANSKAFKTCLKCGKCGRRFRRGILIDETGKEFMRHCDEFMRKEKYNGK